MFYAGIDAGGTSCKCIIIDEKNDVLARVKTGPANYQLVGIDNAVKEIHQVVKKACNKAGIAGVDILGIGMAGAGSDEDRKIIMAKLLPIKRAKKIYLTHDAHIAVLGAHNGKAGIVLIAGTGSIVYGLTENMQTIRAGGWGPILGDEGSGFWIGLKALKYIIKAKEGRIGKTSLVEPVLNYLNIDSLRELIPFIHQGNLPRKKIAAIAPLVIEEMIKGDQIARKIIDRGLNELALTIKVLSDRMDSGRNKIAVTGGLFTNKHIYKIFSVIMYDKYSLEVNHPEYQPVFGAVLYGLLKAGQNLFITMNNTKSEETM